MCVGVHVRVHVRVCVCVFACVCMHFKLWCSIAYFCHVRIILCSFYTEAVVITRTEPFIESNTSFSSSSPPYFLPPQKQREGEGGRVPASLSVGVWLWASHDPP